MTKAEEKAFWKACEAAGKDPASLKMFADALRERGGKGDADMAIALEWMADHGRRPSRSSVYDDFLPYGSVLIYRGWVWESSYGSSMHRTARFIPEPVSVVMSTGYTYRTYRAAVRALANGLRKARACVLLKRELS